MRIIHKEGDLILIVSLKNKFFRHPSETRVIVHSKKDTTAKLWGREIFPAFLVTE